MNILTYVFKGQRGFLARIDNEKLKGVKPIEECYDMGFYPLEVADKCNITIEDCLAEYEDSYEYIGSHEFNNQEKEIVIEEVMNIENKNKLIISFVNKKYYEADLYERMMLIETSRYCEWQSVLTQTLYYAFNEIKQRQDYIKDKIAWLDCDGEECDKKEKEIIVVELNIAKKEIRRYWEEQSKDYKQYYASFAEENSYTDEGEMTFDRVWKIIEEEIIDKLY